MEFIDNDRMKAWGVDVTQMYQDAYDNMRSYLQPIITPVMWALGEDYIFPSLGEGLNDGYHDYIFPVQARKDVFWQMCTGLCYGAAAMLYEEKLYEFAMEHGRNVFILPGSIHEVLLALDDGDVTAAKFAESAKRINRCVLRQEDVLSNSIYYYDRLNRETSIAELCELELPFIKNGPVS